MDQPASPTDPDSVDSLLQFLIAKVAHAAVEPTEASTEKAYPMTLHERLVAATSLINSRNVSRRASLVHWQSPSVSEIASRAGSRRGSVELSLPPITTPNPPPALPTPPKITRASSKHAAAGKKPMPPKTAPANTKSPVQAGRGIVASALQSFEPSRRDSPDDDAAEGLLADVSDNLAAHVATAPSVAGRVQKKLAVVHALSKQKEVPRYMQPLRQSREDSARLAASSEWREPSADDILRWAKEHGRATSGALGVMAKAIADDEADAAETASQLAKQMGLTVDSVQRMVAEAVVKAGYFSEPIDIDDEHEPTDDELAAVAAAAAQAEISELVSQCSVQCLPNHANMRLRPLIATAMERAESDSGDLPPWPDAIDAARNVARAIQSVNRDMVSDGTLSTVGIDAILTLLAEQKGMGDADVKQQLCGLAVLEALCQLGPMFVQRVGVNVRLTFALLQLSRSSDNSVVRGALSMIKRLAHLENTRIMLLRADGLGLLFELLKEVHDGELETRMLLLDIAAAVFQVQSDSTLELLRQKKIDVPATVLSTLCTSAHTDERRAACRALMLLLRDDVLLRKVVECKGVHPVIQLLHAEEVEIQYSAVKALTRFSGSYDEKSTLINLDIISPLLKLLDSPARATRIDAVTVLHKLLSLEQGKAEIVERNGVEQLCHMLRRGMSSNYMPQSADSSELHEHHQLNLSDVHHITAEAMFEEALVACQMLGDMGEHQVAVGQMMEFGVLRDLHCLLRCERPEAQSQGARLLSMLPLVEANDLVVVKECLPFLFQLLSTGSDDVQVYAAQALAALSWNSYVVAFQDQIPVNSRDRKRLSRVPSGRKRRAKLSDLLKAPTRSPRSGVNSSKGGDSGSDTGHSETSEPQHKGADLTVLLNGLGFS